MGQKVVDCLCKDQKEEEKKVSEENKIDEIGNGLINIKTNNDSTIHKMTQMKQIKYNQDNDRGNPIIQRNMPDTPIFKNFADEEIKKIQVQTLNAKSTASTGSHPENISFNIVLEESRKIEFSLKLNEFNSGFAELENVMAEHSINPEIGEDLHILESLAFIKFFHENPTFQPTMSKCLSKLEENLSQELISKVIYNPNSKPENIQKLRAEIIDEYVTKANNMLYTKLPKILLEPYKLNISRIVDRKIKKEKINLKECKIRVKIISDYEKKNISIIIIASKPSTYIDKTEINDLSGIETKDEELIDPKIWGDPDYSHKYQFACEELLESIMSQRLEPFDSRMYKNVNYNELMKAIVGIVQNFKRTFVPQVYEEFKELNNVFIDSLPSSVDKERLLKECKTYLGVLENRPQRKKEFTRLICLFKIMEENFSVTQKLFTIFSLFLGLSGCYHGKPFNININDTEKFPTVSSKTSRPLNNDKQSDHFKNGYYHPIAREASRKILKHFLRRSEPNSTFYSLRKLFAFEQGLSLFLHKHSIKIIHESFLSKEFFLEEKESVDLNEMIKRINELYLKNIKYSQLLQLLLPTNELDPTEGLIKLLEAEKIFKMERINQNFTSRHCVFCLSGYLSENYDGRASWGKIISFFPNSQIVNIRWASTTIADFVGTVAKYTTVVPLIIHFIYRIFKNREPNTFQRLSQNFWKAYGLTTTQQQDLLKNAENEEAIQPNLDDIYPSSSFQEANENAELAGALLAFLIALRAPTDIECISLVCFSLGAQVVNECLCYLKHFDLYNRIHDVIFIGGATQIDLNSSRNLESFQTVTGKVFNSFSQSDWVLWLVYKIGSKFPPIGTYTFQMTNPEKLENPIFYTGKAFRNYENQFGHLQYRENMDAIMAEIFKRYLVNI